jgi:alginate O-acetyltransferase complex protein AlgI
MLFNTYQYWAFFLAVLVLFYAVPLRTGKIVLLVASYVFYMSWDYRFAGLILASTVIDYTLGIIIAGASARWKKPLVTISVIVNLGILGFFKYYNFFATSFAAAFGISPDSLVLNLVLPVGISFYTFKSMSYTIDVYRGRFQPVRSLPDFALFVAFFPELVAGPIVRAECFIPQLHDWRSPSEAMVADAINLIIVGMVKKLVFADRFALAADAYFRDPGSHPGAIAAWCGTFAFAMQIFFDFSGYTDIARGCAQLLGIQFPLNFARPYLATNISDFWRRWHISLSQWLRDYLYIPLGGNRHGTLLTYRNLMLTMALGGLWHGASWNFVIWGMLHGTLLIGHRIFVKMIDGTALARQLAMAAFTPVKVLLTFTCVLITWVFFRAATLHDSAYILGQMFGSAGWRPGAGLTAGLIVLAGIALPLAILEERYGVVRRLAASPSWCRVPAYVTLFFTLELFAVTGRTIPFIYFQF